MGTRITFECPGGTEAGGYLATAQGAKSGVIVLQEWWGLNPQICEVADRFAEQGFTALAGFALAFGAVNGGCIALYPAVAATWFGTRSLGAILGALYVSVGIAAVAGGSLAGLLFDLSGSYTSSILLAGGSAVLSALAVRMAARAGGAKPQA